MDPGAEGGVGGGPGEGDFGGEFGGPDYGGGGSSGSSADINAALDDFFGEIDAASAAMQGKSKAVDKVVNFIMNKVKSIPFVGTAIELAQLAIDIQKDLGVKLSADQINAVVNGIGRGDNVDTIARGLRNDLGIKTPKTKENDPKSNEFWEQFVNEWKDAKANIKANDQFKKDKLKPAFETYRERLGQLAGYEKDLEGELAGIRSQPLDRIGIKMGDFSTEFNTKRSMVDQQRKIENAMVNSQRKIENNRINAQRILGSELSETDVMQPKLAEQDYLSQLMDLAQWQQEMKNKINITQNQSNAIDAQRGDQGSWLDIINDTIKVGKSGAELWDMFK